MDFKTEMRADIYLQDKTKRNRNKGLTMNI